MAEHLRAGLYFLAIQGGSCFEYVDADEPDGLSPSARPSGGFVHRLSTMSHYTKMGMAFVGDAPDDLS